MNIKDDLLLDAFVQSVKKHFQNRLKKILLFGSRARGDYSAESDYDCILLVDNISKNDQEFVNDLELKVLLENFVLFSAFLIEEYKFKQRKYEPFFMNAVKEGISLS